jgi:hypothetical protein
MVWVPKKRARVQGCLDKGHKEKIICSGYSVDYLERFRRFFIKYPRLLDPVDLWRPGHLNQNLTRSHYARLLKIDDRQKRDFYELESTTNSWSCRQLSRQVDTLFYERLAKSRDKRGVRALSVQGQMIRIPRDLFKDPYIP